MKMGDNKQRLFEVMGRLDPSFKILNEAQAVPFKFIPSYDQKESYEYSFTVDGVNMICNIYRDVRNHDDYEYEVSFHVKDKPSHYRVGKDLRFMNTVLETVAECIKDFLKREPDVNKLRLVGAVGQGDSNIPFDETMRSRAYLRFINNKFPEYDVQHGGKNIIINIPKTIENEYETMKKLIKNISDVEEIEDNHFDGYFNNNNSWNLIVGGKNSNYGSFYVDIERDVDDYTLKVSESYRTENDVHEYIDSFEELVNYINEIFFM